MQHQQVSASLENHGGLRTASNDDFGDFTRSEATNVWADSKPAAGAAKRVQADVKASGKEDDDDFGDFIDVTNDEAVNSEGLSLEPVPEPEPVQAQANETRPEKAVDFPPLQPATAESSLPGIIPPPPAPMNPSKNSDASLSNIVGAAASSRGQRSRAASWKSTSAIQGSANPLDLASAQILDWLEAPSSIAVGQDDTYTLDDIDAITHRLDILVPDSVDEATVGGTVTACPEPPLDPWIASVTSKSPTHPGPFPRKPDSNPSHKLWDIIWPQPAPQAELIHGLDTDRGDLVQAYLRLVDLSKKQ
ncbi:hypothetical protein EC988_001210 [Linderina pennispora]|nr:hypothetical protein EC988_001210 [Linderina pennispora]